MATSEQPVTFVFDFDGVIADTSRLKDTIFSNVETAGYARHNIVTTYEAVKKEQGGQDPAEFARRMSSGDAAKEARTAKAWREGEKRIVQFVCKEMLALVASMRQAGYATVLLTAGRPDVQLRKVTDCGLDNVERGPFQEIVYVEEDGTGENKIQELGRLWRKYGSLVMFDDQAYNIEPFASHFAPTEVLPVFVRLFPDERNATYTPPYGIPTISSVEDLYIEKILSLLP